MRHLGTAALLAGMIWVAGCDRPTAEAQDANRVNTAAPAGPVNGGPINNGPINNAPVNQGNVTPGQRVDNSVTKGNDANSAAKNPAPAPGSNTSSAGGATSTDGRGGDGSSLGPTVSGKSPYAGTADSASK
ncbi:MAG TPA: hypothetical protein VFE58_18275 [Tepidisphaeraceae bacterium]|nr:hypothetical protein [Tepidisphaeraceae bacterium]